MTDVLDQLAYPDMQTRIYSIADPYPGTLEWLFHHPSYLDWLAQDGGMLGIRGGPGTGKSTALKFLIQKERAQKEENRLVLSFFFHRRGHELQWTRLGMYRSLLFQLISKVPSTGAIYRRWAQETSHDLSLVQMSAHALREVFIDALLVVSPSARVRIFLDALDEAGNEEARAVIADLRRINAKVRLVTKGLTICFACRYYPTIVVDNGFEIKLENNNAEDIEHFVRSSLDKLPEYRLESRSKLAEQIVERSSGFFLWAMLAVQSVRRGYDNGYSRAKILQKIGEMPPFIEDLYTHMLAENDFNEKRNMDITVALIQWILFSRRPVTLEELRYALGWDPILDLSETPSTSREPIVRSETSMLEFLETYMKGFTKIVESVDHDGQVKSFVQFSHHTVFEYFSYHVEAWLQPAMSRESWVGNSNDRLAKTCYYFIKAAHDEWFELGRNEIRKLPFCDYAVEFCFVHAEQAKRHGFPQSYLPSELGSEGGRDLLIQWAKAYGQEGLEQRSLGQFPTWEEVAVAFKLIDP